MTDDLDQIEALLEAPLKKDLASAQASPTHLSGKDSTSKSREEEDRRDEDRRQKRSSEYDRDDPDGRKYRRRSRSRDRERRRSRSRERDRRRDYRDDYYDRDRRGRSPSPRRYQDSSRDRERDKERERRRRSEERRKEREREALLDPAEREAIERERDERTIFARNLPVKADEEDIEKFFNAKAGKVRDIRLITDKNSRKSKGVGYIEFYDRSSVPAALKLTGTQFMGQTISISEAATQAEKNRTHAATMTTTKIIGPTRLYVGSLHFNITEEDLKRIFSQYGELEFIDLHKDVETGRSKGFGFVQFRAPDAARKALQQANGLEVAGRPIKVGMVNETAQPSTPHTGSSKKSLDLDDDEGGLSLNAHSRVMLMAKLQRPTAAAAPAPTPAPVTPPPVAQPTILSPCVLLRHMYDPSEESSANWDKEIEDDVADECSKFGSVVHIHVPKTSSGEVYLKFGSVPAAQNAINSLKGRWFAQRQIHAEVVPEAIYYAKFPEAMSR